MAEAWFDMSNYEKCIGKQTLEHKQKFLENIPVLTMQLETPLSYFTRQLLIFVSAFDITSKPRTSSSLPSMALPFLFMLQNLLHKIAVNFRKQQNTF